MTTYRCGRAGQKNATALQETEANEEPLLGCGSPYMWSFLPVGRRRMRRCGSVSMATKTQWIHSHMLRRHNAKTTDDEIYEPAVPLWRLTHVAASWVASTGFFTSRAVGFRRDGKRGSA